MPLVKLWNSLRSRSKDPAPPQESVPAENPGTAGLGSASKRRLFGGGPHRSLCKQLKGLDVASILEVSVGDGTRALAVLQALSKSSKQSIRYIAIDEFELGGGQIGLRDFFCLLREHDVRPKLFPETLDGGIRNVANTLGTVDVVLIATPIENWQNPVTLQLLSRISHRNTVIFFDDGDDWNRYHLDESNSMRRAA